MLFFLYEHDFSWKSFNVGFRFYGKQLFSNWANYPWCCMNLEKHHAKLLKLQAKAEACISRKEAQKILKKSAKTIHKISRP